MAAATPGGAASREAPTPSLHIPENSYTEKKKKGLDGGNHNACVLTSDSDAAGEGKAPRRALPTMYYTPANVQRNRMSDAVLRDNTWSKRLLHTTVKCPTDICP